MVRTKYATVGILLIMICFLGSCTLGAFQSLKEKVQEFEIKYNRVLWPKYALLSMEEETVHAFVDKSSQLRDSLGDNNDLLRSYVESVALNKMYTVDMSKIALWVAENKSLIDDISSIVKNEMFNSSLSMQSGRASIDDIDKALLFFSEIVLYVGSSSENKVSSLSMCETQMCLVGIMGNKCESGPEFILAYLLMQRAWHMNQILLDSHDLSIKELRRLYDVMLRMENTEFMLGKSLYSDARMLHELALVYLSGGNVEGTEECISKSLDYMDMALQCTANPDAISLQRIRQIESYGDSDAECENMLFYCCKYIPEEHLHPFQALQDDLRIKLALEMYEREHGAYPASLETLIPSYLDEMPVHPLGDGSYERTGDGYELSWRIES